jgi:ArsR family transcriptional regulator
MNQFIKIMKALSDPNRLKIVKMLQQRALCVCEIQSALGISQPNVSSHLRILQNAGLVEFHKDGLWVNYYLSGGEDSPYVASLLGNLRHWLEDDPEIAKLMKKVPTLDRTKILGR